MAGTIKRTALITKKKTIIEKMDAYKKIVIYEYVTDKKEIR